MKKLMETIKKHIKNKDYAELGKIATAIEYIVEESMMGMYVFSMPLANDSVVDVFLSQLKALGFPIADPEEIIICSATTMTLADQYSDADYFAVSNAWWTALLTAMDAVSGIPCSPVIDGMCDFLAPGFDEDAEERAKDVLEYVENGFPDDDD